MILCFVISIVSAVVACWHGARLYIFKHCPHLTAKTGAWREDMTYKQNQYHESFKRRFSFFVKHETHSVYRYEVDGHSYYIKKVDYCHPSDTTYLIQVVYLKRFPRIHNTEENELFDMSILWAGIFTTIALLFFIGAFML